MLARDCNLRTGALYDIYQDLGTQSTACCLDAGGFAEACQHIVDDVAACDVVLVSRRCMWRKRKRRPIRALSAFRISAKSNSRAPEATSAQLHAGAARAMMAQCVTTAATGGNTCDGLYVPASSSRVSPSATRRRPRTQPFRRRAASIPTSSIRCRATMRTDAPHSVTPPCRSSSGSSPRP